MKPVVLVKPKPEVIVVTAPGTFGLPGRNGKNGQPRFSGQGPPTVVIGAEPYDEYLDTLTGDIYQLT